MMRRRSTFVITVDGEGDNEHDNASSPLLHPDHTPSKEGEVNSALLGRPNKGGAPNGTGTWSGVWRPSRSRAVLLAFTYAAVLALGYLIAQRTIIPPPSKPTPRRTLLFEGRPGTEGIGSVMQRFKGVIAFAEANNMELIMTETHSTHGYVTSELLNRRGEREELTIRLPVCHLDDHMDEGAVCRFAKTACANFNGHEWDPAAQANLGSYCQTFVYRGNSCFSETMNQCTRDWVKTRLLDSWNTTYETREGQVGIHIRWGDSSMTEEEFEGKFRGSMSVDNINLVVGKLQKAGKAKSIRVLSENLPKWVMDKLEFDFELVGGTDDISSIRTLAESEYLLLGGSSYGVVLAQVSGAKTIFSEERTKYDGFAKLGIRVLAPNVPMGEI